MSALASFLGSLVRAFLYPFTTSFTFIQRLFLYLTSWASTSPKRHVADDPVSVADRWVRELEEETGAIRESRLSGYDTYATGAEAQAGPGPSTLSRRNESARSHRRLIPEFYLGSYESALNQAKREARFLCVVIVSEEHDDVPEFKRSTLLDPEFNKILKDNHFLVWGGDTRDYEGSQAAQKLGTTTYPFVAFVALQPQRSHTRERGSSSSPALTVLSRHQGPSTPVDEDLPISDIGPTSARALNAHLTNALLPRVSPFLTRLQAEEAERIAQRRLREEQEIAFARNAEEDRKRILARMEEEKRQKEEIEMQEIVRAKEEEERKKAIEEREKREQARLLWYRYARRNLLSPENKPGKGSLRIGVRLPNGLKIRHFSESDSVTSLYVFVASQLIPKEYPVSEDPESPPSGFAPGEAGINADNWSFKLATSFPRREIRWSASTLLTDVNGLQGGAQLVVEAIPGQALIPGNGQNQDEDSDYNTEED